MGVLEISFFGAKLENYLAAIGVIAGAILAAIILNTLLKRYAHRITKRTDTKVDDLIAEKILSPLPYALIVLGVVIAKDQIDIAPSISVWVDRIALALGLSLLFVMVIRATRVGMDLLAEAYIKRLGLRDPDNIQDQAEQTRRLKKQASEIVTTVLAVLAVLTVLSNLGLDLKAIWASLGIGTVAVALAVQDPMRNLVGRMYIYGTGLFDVGHFIEFGGYSGTVKQITSFRTYLEVFSDMTVVSIPNADFIKGTVKTYHGRTKFMFKWDLDVPYDVAPEKIETLVEKLRNTIANRPGVDAARRWVYLDRLGPASKVVRVWFQASVPSWADSLFYGEETLQEIQRVFESLHIDFAFPTQTLYLNPNQPFSYQYEGAARDRSSADASQ